MAKTSKIAKNEQRRLALARYAVRRAVLKAVIASPRTSDDERGAAQRELRRQPRDVGATRLRNRDAWTDDPATICAPSVCPASPHAVRLPPL